MQRGTIIALTILVALGVVYFATRTTTRQTQRAPLTVEKVENLDRIRIVPPGGEGESQQPDAGSGSDSDASEAPTQKVVLEKRDDGWWVTKPVEAPAAESVAEDIDELFGQSIETDALELGTDQAQYGVGTRAGIELSLFGGGASEPSVRLVVGEQIEVDNTGAGRTFIRKPDSSEIYRAQAALGSFVRQSVEEFRSDEIVDLDKEKLSRLEWKRPDGSTIVLEKKEGDWKMLRPQVDWSLDSGAVSSIGSALAGLSAEGFADGRSAGEIGLETPATRLSFEAGDDSGTLLVGTAEADGGTKYYAKLAEKRFQYEISSYAGDKFIADLGDLRSKTPRTFDREAITRVEFPGEDRVVVEKANDSWALVRPEAEDELNESKLDSRLSSVAELTVEGFPEVEPGEVGLTGASDRVRFQMEGGDRYALLIGGAVEEGKGDRYVKFDDGDEVYSISSRVADELRPSVDDLVGESASPGPGKGLGKMGGAGMKQKLRKMQMMKKLKRQMRRKGGP